MLRSWCGINHKQTKSVLDMADMEEAGLRLYRGRQDDKENHRNFRIGAEIISPIRTTTHQKQRR